MCCSVSLFMDTNTHKHTQGFKVCASGGAETLMAAVYTWKGPLVETETEAQRHTAAVYFEAG